MVINKNYKKKIKHKIYISIGQVNRSQKKSKKQLEHQKQKNGKHINNEQDQQHKQHQQSNNTELVNKVVVCFRFERMNVNANAANSQ